MRSSINCAVTSGIILTPGNAADCTVGPECVNMVAGI
jgi:hypothetical protein